MNQFKTSYYGALALVLLTAFSINAFAQNDCGQEADEQADKCEAGVLSAKNESRSAGSAGMNGDGYQMASEANSVAGVLDNAKNNCHKVHLENCVQSCKRAMSTATTQQLADKINDNLHKCRRRIALAMGDANESAAGMRKVAADSTNSANCASGNGDCKQVHQVGGSYQPVRVNYADGTSRVMDLSAAKIHVQTLRDLGQSPAYITGK